MYRIDDRKMGWPPALDIIDTPTEYVSRGTTPPRPPRQRGKTAKMFDNMDALITNSIPEYVRQGKQVPTVQLDGKIVALEGPFKTTREAKIAKERKRLDIEEDEDVDEPLVQKKAPKKVIPKIGMDMTPPPAPRSLLKSTIGQYNSSDVKHACVEVAKAYQRAVRTGN